MAVTSPSAAASRDKVSEQAKTTTRTRGGVRVVGGRIYDPQNGKTCHQCRQKTMDFVASCNNSEKGKQCTIKFCHKCLLNRYGENAEQVSQLHDWVCPKCKGICNCSVCMKKLGQRPTGMLVHKAKENGFSSVSQMLQVKGHGTSSQEAITDKVESVVASTRKPGKENSFHENSESKLANSNTMPHLDEKIVRNRKQGEQKEPSNGRKVHKAASSGKNFSKKHKTEEAPKEVQQGKSDRTTDGECIEDNEIHATKCPKEIGFVACAGVGNVLKANDAGDCDVAKNSLHVSKVKENGRSRVKIAEQNNHNVEVSDIDVSISNPALHKTNLPSNETEPRPSTSSVCEDSKTRSDSKEALGSCNIEICEQQDQQFDVSIHLPEAASSLTVAGVELSPEVAGPVLQFLEFCAAFGEVLDLKKGQPESVIREIARGRRGRHAPYSSIAQIHIQLLSIVEKDLGQEFSSLSTNGQNSWVEALGQCISESEFEPEDITSDVFVKGIDAYNMLSISQKLRILNFLCDEVLCTTTLRDWIEDQHTKMVDMEKEAREKVHEAKCKEKLLKKKMLDEVAKAIIAKNGAPLSISEHEAILKEIKREAAHAQSEAVEAMQLLPKKRQRSDALRTEPVIIDDEGHAFWSLKGCKGKMDVFLQDFGALDECQPDDKWFGFEERQKEDVEKYISSLSSKRLRVQRRDAQAAKC